MPITTDQVEKIAKLVKLDIKGQEGKLAKMFTETLDYISILDELDTTGIKETYQVTGTQNVFQQSDKDSDPTTLPVIKAVLNAKSVSNDLIETQGVFDR